MPEQALEIANLPGSLTLKSPEPILGYIAYSYKVYSGLRVNEVIQSV